MYFPYLFARAEELRALRAVSSELPVTNTVKPILEPVKENTRELIACLTQLGQDGVGALVIMNPQQGDFRTIDSRRLRTELTDTFANFPTIIPAIIFGHGSRVREVRGFMNHYRDRDVSIVYKAPDLDDGEVRAFCAERRIRFHVNRHDGLDPAQRALLPRGKAVDIRDRFNSLDRNADYMGSEFFCDSHQSFRESAIGYGDYSITGPLYHPGGGPAHAVAIHAVYRQRRTGNVWVEHFVSDDTEIEVGTVQEKFHQAAAKLVAASTARVGDFGTNGALAAFRSDVQNNHYPGLGVSKRRQIHHQIAFNHQLLAGDL
jgi:hypothetical protein